MDGVPLGGGDMDAAGGGGGGEGVALSDVAAVVVEKIFEGALKDDGGFGGGCVAVNGDLCAWHEGVEEALAVVGWSVAKVHGGALTFALLGLAQEAVEEVGVENHGWMGGRLGARGCDGTGMGADSVVGRMGR